ncbi:MAG: hypothetical protein V4558_16495 [Gemmatimonadota bacterium]
MHRVRSAALAAVVAGVLLVGAAYLATWAGRAPAFALYAMIAGIALQVSGITILGGARPGRTNRPVLIAAGFLAGVIILGFGAAALLPPENIATGPYFLGLPRRAAIILLGVGVLPFLVLPFLYAADFDAGGLDESSLERLRDECRRLRETHTGKSSS